MIHHINHIAQLWSGWILPITIQAALLIAILAVVDLLIRKWAWPQLRYALWLLVLLKLVLPPGLTAPTSVTSRLEPISNGLPIAAQPIKTPASKVCPGGVVER